MAAERLINKCRCGAFSLLTATGFRYEENAGAICRHRVKSCDWFAPAPSPPQTDAPWGGGSFGDPAWDDVPGPPQTDEGEACSTPDACQGFSMDEERKHGPWCPLWGRARRTP